MHILQVRAVVGYMYIYIYILQANSCISGMFGLLWDIYLYIL